MTNLTAFAVWCIEQGSWVGDELDGADIQDKAVELGILIQVLYESKAAWPQWSRMLSLVMNGTNLLTR